MNHEQIKIPYRKLDDWRYMVGVLRIIASHRRSQKSIMENMKRLYD